MNAEMKILGCASVSEAYSGAPVSLFVRIKITFCNK